MNSHETMKESGQDSCTGGTARDRRNQRRFTWLLAAWAVLFLVSTYLIAGEYVANEPLGWLVAALPSIVAVFAVLAFWRYLGEADELTRAIELRALAIAVSAGFIIWTASNLLGKSGVPIGDWPSPVVLVMIGGYVLARFLSGRYYR